MTWRYGRAPKLNKDECTSLNSQKFNKKNKYENQNNISKKQNNLISQIKSDWKTHQQNGSHENRISDRRQVREFFTYQLVALNSIRNMKRNWENSWIA